MVNTTNQTDSLDSSWEKVGINQVAAEIEEHYHYKDQPDQGSSTAIMLEFQLTQSLLSRVKVNKDNKNASSDKQAQLDLNRMNFVINGKIVDKEYILKLYGENNYLIPNGSEDYCLFAKRVFAGMFEYAKAEVPNFHGKSSITSALK